MKKMSLRLLLAVLLVGVALALALGFQERLRAFVGGLLLNQQARSQNGNGSFYGRCIDQNGAGIPGVSIQMEYTRDYGYMRRGVVHLNGFTDAGGRFQFTDLYGNALHFAGVEKEGYYVGMGRSQFGFGPKDPDHYIADPAHPEIIHMWKRGKEEKLLYAAFNDFYPPDRASLGIDFFADYPNLKEGGNESTSLFISVKNLHREKSQDRNKKYEPTDWVLTLDIREGGLQETSDMFTYRAPPDGYKPHRELRKNASDPDWKSFKKHFYVRFEKRKAFAAVRVQAEMNPIFDRVFLRIRARINAADSPNLEPSSQEVFD